MEKTMPKKPTKQKKFFDFLFEPEKPKNEYDKSSRVGLKALYRKELADSLTSVRSIIILILIIVTIVLSLISGISGIKSSLNAASSGSSNANPALDFVFLKLFTSSGGLSSANSNALPSYITLIALLGPLMGLVLGFDSINGERSRNTLNRLVSQPIYRDAVINGKFLAGVTVIGIMVATMTLAISGVGLFVIGVPPSMEEIGRILLYMIFTIVYMSLWLALSMLFSLLFRHAATSAMTVIAVWLFLSIFLSLISGLVADGLYPVSDTSDVSVQVQNYNTEAAIDRISPSTLYNEAINTILNPDQRFLGVVTTEQVQNAVSAPLSLGQSLLLVWPHLTGLLALTLICFAISYIFFMRQEIRAG